MTPHPVLPNSEQHFAHEMDPHEFVVPDMINAESLRDVILMFHRVNVIKFGSFTLKSGVQSPIYIDLREIISYPRLLRTAARLISKAIYETDAVVHEVLCGVPYAALPIATLIACDKDIPMVMRRKEVKDHGTKKIVEGKVERGAPCLLVDDVCTSGQSILETAEDLRAAGLIVEDAVVLLDRESGGAEYLQQNGIKLHYALNITQLCSTLVAAGEIPIPVYEAVKSFLAVSRKKPEVTNGTSGVVSSPKPATSSWLQMTFTERAKQTKNPVARHLFEIMENKHTTLAVAVDVTTTAGILQLAEALGPHICLLKLHADIIQDFKADFITELVKISQAHKFLLMEDRKFADIGFTVSHQMSGGVHSIANWADLVTVHALPGPGIVSGLKEGIKRQGNREIGFVFIAEMSSSGALTDGDYAKRTVKICDQHNENVVGLVCQTNCTDNPAFIRMTPGVHMGAAGDGLGQNYSSPQEVMGKCADVIIVGRGITESSDPAAVALEYKLKGFAAYRSRTGDRS
ncbi:uncharacterized protein LOC129584965 isoform X2 [Paramacrobiotus metropolitanus]|uniref:uncharacterized protein LOC129584965 isoform X2 n=1 Tax=Paramacrobiotus metropolitanus TaxID=2943436 RepID=UPI00244628BF|nr:uncharacterized protein LOC129584965 isoform X2 [Paramacrobiotus metropolitanus]